MDGLTNSVCSHTLLGCVCTHTNSGSSFPEPLQLSLLDCINPRACARAAARDVRCSQLFTVIYISSITVNYCEAVFLLRLVHCVYTAVSLVPRDVSCILWSAHRAPLILSYILYFLNFIKFSCRVTSGPGGGGAGRRNRITGYVNVTVLKISG